MSGSTTGPGGPLQERFEAGMAFLATALAMAGAQRAEAAVVTAASDALRCFLAILQAGADAHLPYTEGQAVRLRNRLEALLTPHQSSVEAARNALDAARLARDEAARLLPRLVEHHRSGTSGD